MGIPRSAYGCAVYSLAEVKRLHHLHRRPHRGETPGHLKTCRWIYRKYSTQSFSSRGRVVAQTSRKGGKNYPAARSSSLGEELDCGVRGPLSLTCRVICAKLPRISCAMTISKNTSYHTLLKNPDSIFTGLTGTQKTSTHSPPTLSISSQTNGVLSRQRPPCSTPSKKSGILRRISARQENGRAKHLKVSSSAHRSSNPPPTRMILPPSHRINLGPLSSSKSNSTSHT